MHSFLKLGAVLGLAALVAAPAHAQNLVQDGDFEQAATGYPYNLSTPFDAYWVVTQGDVLVDDDPTFVFDGSNSLDLTPDTSGTSQIAQSLATTAGNTYTLSFYANNDVGNQVLNVGFGTTALAPISVPGNGFNSPSDYTFFQYTVVATSASTDLTFTSVNDTVNTTELDDISVVPAAVPEASTTVSFGLLLMLGLGGATLRARRKAQAQ